MIKYFLLSCCILLTLTVSAQKKDSVIVKTRVNCNHCRVCETCGQKFETDLYYVKGIKLVEYRDADTTILVQYNPKKTSPDIIRQEISKLGYDADGIPADPEGIAKLDGCCRKNKE